MVTALAALATLVMALPVVRSPATRIFGRELVGRQHDPFTVMARFRARPDWSFAMQPVTDVPGHALTRVAGPVAAYNVVVLSSFPLAALFTYLLARELGAAHGAAAFAGLAFGFSTFHVAHAAYHPHVSQVQWLPLYLLALWRSLGAWTWRRGLAVAAAAVAVTLSDFYGGLIAVVLTPAMLAARVSTRAPAARGLVPTGLLLAALAGAGAAYVAVMAPWLLAGDPGPLAFPLEAVVEHGALWQAYLLPAVEHPVLGTWSREVLRALGVRQGIVEQQIGVPWSVLALAVVGVVWAKGTSGTRPRAVGLALLAIGGLAWLCSLAPGQRLGPVTLPAPAAWIHAALPVFRAFARFGLAVALVTAVLAGLGWAALRASAARGARILGWLLALGTCFELWPLPWRSRDVLPTEAHRHLAGMPGPLTVFDSAPLTPTDVMIPVFMGHRVVFNDRPGDAWWGRDTADRLSSLGVTHVIVRHGPAGGGAVAAPPIPPGLTPVHATMDGVVYRVDAQVTGAGPERGTPR